MVNGGKEGRVEMVVSLDKEAMVVSPDREEMVGKEASLDKEEMAVSQDKEAMVETVVSLDKEAVVVSPDREEMVGKEASLDKTETENRAQIMENAMLKVSTLLMVTARSFIAALIMERVDTQNMSLTVLKALSLTRS
jgi:hypothetical protein